MKKIYAILFALMAIGCAPKKAIEVPFDVEAYKSEIETWHQKRVEDLKGPKGWLNLVGLFWLNDGINTFGSGQKNNVIFPEGKIPERAGFFLLKKNTVTLEPAPNVNITSGGKPIKSMVVFHPDSAKPAVQEYETLQWFIIKRDDKFGIRLRDFKSPGIENFTGIERYPVDPAWRLEATFEKADSTRTIDITNILGQTTARLSPGTLVFSIKGKEYRLDVLGDGKDDEYFIIVGDSTNTHETYGAGRYMEVKTPDVNGRTIVDFNKAYNPPCAFTSFATCPVPPKQNVLTAAITAGEKNYSIH